MSELIQARPRFLRPSVDTWLCTSTAPGLRVIGAISASQNEALQSLGEICARKDGLLWSLIQKAPKASKVSS